MMEKHRIVIYGLALCFLLALVSGASAVPIEIFGYTGPYVSTYASTTHWSEQMFTIDAAECFDTVEFYSISAGARTVCVRIETDNGASDPSGNLVHVDGDGCVAVALANTWYNITLDKRLCDGGDLAAGTLYHVVYNGSGVSTIYIGFDNAAGLTYARGWPANYTLTSGVTWLMVAVGDNMAGGLYDVAGGAAGANSTQTLGFGASDHGNGTHHNTAFNWSMVPDSAIGMSHVEIMVMNTTGGGWYLHENKTAGLANATEFSTLYYTASNDQFGICVNATLFAVNGSQVSAPGGVACSYMSFWDDVNPTVVIGSPTDGGSYERGARPDLEAYCNDTYLLNCTAELFTANNNSRIHYVNTNAGGATYLTHNITSFSDYIASFYWNLSAMDSHTGASFKADAIKQNKGKTNLKIESGNDYLNFDVNTVVDFSELDDRIKFKWNETVGLAGNLNRNIRITSASPITIVDWTKYGGHIVNARQWADFDDLEEGGYTLKVTRVNATSVTVAVTASGLAQGTYEMDPATGGLNFGSQNISYSITNYSTGLSVGVIGAYMTSQPITWQAVFSYATNSTFISGATCNVTITDTVGANTTYGMNELANHYNWTGYFTLPGTYAWHSSCRMLYYDNANAYGSIVIMTNLPEFDIWAGITPSQTCHNTTHLRKTWATNFSGIDYIRTAYEQCFYECGGHVCYRSLIREGGVWTLLLIVAAILLIALWLARALFGRPRK